ncbi:MAG TPA: DUF4349 domain-containing protein [Polyangiaceae bacterium]|jgi:hypothetical protein
MRRPARFALTSFLSLFSLAACGGQAVGMGSARPAAEAPQAAYSQPPAPPMAAVQAAASPPSVTSNASTTASPPAASLRAPLVTYAGEMALRVEKNTPATLDAVVAIAESMGGYMAGRQDDRVEVRVPSARFREALGKIEPLGEVTHRSVQATDVSDEFHDAEVRLQNLRATRTRLEGLLAQAKTLVDTLAVERELERVSQEIDRLEGRLEFLKSRIAYSSIAVTAEARQSTQVAVTALAPKRVVELPVDWLGELGVDRLVTLR